MPHPILSRLQQRPRRLNVHAYRPLGQQRTGSTRVRSRWNDYVKATKLVGTDKVIQLLECCDNQLRKDLTRNAGGTLTGKTEDEVLTAMKTLAVREENVMVARVTLRNMRQDRGKPIRVYGARQTYVDSYNDVPTVKPMWTIPKSYYEMCYVEDWRTQRYNLIYWVTKTRI